MPFCYIFKTRHRPPPHSAFASPAWLVHVAAAASLFALCVCSFGPIFQTHIHTHDSHCSFVLLGEYEWWEHLSAHSLVHTYTCTSIHVISVRIFQGFHTFCALFPFDDFFLRPSYSFLYGLLRVQSLVDYLLNYDFIVPFKGLVKAKENNERKIHHFEDIIIL